MTYQLVMKSGPYQDKEFPLEKSEMIVGRDTTTDIVISDAEISRRHARIYKLGESYMVEDLGSTNGTFVNGQRLSGPHALLPGETIRFGENIMLVFEAPLPAYNYDPNATIITAGEALPPPPVLETPPPVIAPPPFVPEPAFKASLPEEPTPQPAFAGVPEPVAPVLKKSNKNRNLVLAGVGCAVLLCCSCLGIFLYWFDSNNYWSLLGF